MPRMKLGKLAPKLNHKTLSFAAFLKDPFALPVPNEKNFWEYKVPPATIGMYGNDEVGDCTCAEIAHDIILKTAHTGTVFFPDPAAVLAMYSAISGYIPGNPATDNGCAITDVLNYMVTTGLQGHKYDAWAAVDPTNYAHRNLATCLFGGCNVGVQLPNAAQDQFSANQTWTVVPGDSIEGGHCILESGYGSAGRNFETWGKGDQKATNDWDKAYTDEVYVVLTHDWIDIASGLSPDAMNYGALQDALTALKAA